MGKFRKKLVVIDAFQYRVGEANEATFADWPDWAKDMLKHNVDGMVVARSDPKRRTIEAFLDHLVIHTGTTPMHAVDGDWIVKGMTGDLYPIKPGIFAATYEEVRAGDMTPGG